MPITLIYGLPGRNKSHFGTYYALALAEKYHKSLVLSYQLHPDNLIRYCQNMGYEWLLKSMSEKKTVYFCDIEEHKEEFLTIPDSICVCDESSWAFPARGSGAVGIKQSNFLKDLTQVRHRRQYVIFIAQSQEQIDLAIKVLAEEVIQCNGISFYDPQIGSQRLQYKIVRRFSPDKFASWSTNPRLRGNPIKTHLMANKSWLSFLTVSDFKLFGVYSSFALLHAGRQIFPDSKIQYVINSAPVSPSSGSSQTSDKSSKVSQVRNKSTVRKIDLNDLDVKPSPMQADLSYEYFDYIPLVPLFFISSPFSRFLYSYLPSDVLPIWERLKSRFSLKRYPYFVLSSGKKVYLSFNPSSMYHRLSICMILLIVCLTGLNLISLFAAIF
jgi:hypothetical protein